jgi:hypothetical protein
MYKHAKGFRGSKPSDLRREGSGEGFVDRHSLESRMSKREAREYIKNKFPKTNKKKSRPKSVIVRRGPSRKQRQIQVTLELIEKQKKDQSWNSCSSSVSWIRGMPKTRTRSRGELRISFWIPARTLVVRRNDGGKAQQAPVDFR